MDGEKVIQNNEFTIREKDKEIKRLNLELNTMRNKNDKLIDDNSRLYLDNDQGKNHINLTTEQNNRVISHELNVIILFFSL